MTMWPKPKDVKKEPVVERVFVDGRTKINQLCKAGRDLYQERKRTAWEKQGRTCGICHKPLAWKDSMVDHKRPRSVGHDDRQENLAAVHALCNSVKGSQQHGYYDVP
jgi:5-methylcytosine-specific restriction endonuclease McrA